MVISGQGLFPILLEKGHDIVCLVRDKRRFHEQSDYSDKVTLLQGDLLKKESIEAFPKDIEAAYYLVHSMSQNEDFAKLEAESAQNFVDALDKTQSRQAIFLSGITNDGNLSKHLQSRRHVEDVLEQAKAPLTALRASIIIGSGSCIFRDHPRPYRKITADDRSPLGKHQMPAHRHQGCFRVPRRCVVK